MLTPLVMLALLVVPWLVARAARWPAPRADRAAVAGITLLFLFTGVGHFLAAERMSRLIPAAFPVRLLLIHASGVVEIALALTVLIPRLRRAAAWALIVLLVALLPFNVIGAIERVPFGGHAWGPVYLLIRVPLQVIIIAWVWWFGCRPDRRDPR